MSETKNCRCGGCAHSICENRRGQHTSHSYGSDHEHPQDENRDSGGEDYASPSEHSDKQPHTIVV